MGVGPSLSRCEPIVSSQDQSLWRCGSSELTEMSCWAWYATSPGSAVVGQRFLSQLGAVGSSWARMLLSVFSASWASKASRAVMETTPCHDWVDTRVRRAPLLAIVFAIAEGEDECPLLPEGDPSFTEKPCWAPLPILRISSAEVTRLTFSPVLGIAPFSAIIPLSRGTVS